MDYKMKEGQIMIFKNEKKEGNQPDYTGKAMLGEEMTISLWVNESKTGKKYKAGQIQPKGIFIKNDSKTDDNLPF